MTRYWLMKSEPDVYGIDDLRRDGRAPWDGVRNYQARNFMRDDMAVGDAVLFYHSNAEPPGVAGLARVSRSAFTDATAWDRRSPYFDPKSSPSNPRWWMVELAFAEKFPAVVPLAVLKADPRLSKMVLVRKGSRLSVQPVTPEEFRVVCDLARGRVNPRPA